MSFTQVGSIGLSLILEEQINHLLHDVVDIGIDFLYI